MGDLGQSVCRGYCTACWLAEMRRTGQVEWMRHEDEPWRYPRTHIAYARDWSYTLVKFVGGLKMRIYDWELRHV